MSFSSYRIVTSNSVCGTPSNANADKILISGNDIFQDRETFEQAFRGWHDPRCRCRQLNDKDKNKYHYDSNQNYHYHCEQVLSHYFNTAKGYGVLSLPYIFEYIDELLEINNVTEKLPLSYGVCGISSMLVFSYKHENVTFYAFIDDRSKYMYWFYGFFDPWGRNLRPIKIWRVPKEVLMAYEDQVNKQCTVNNTCPFKTSRFLSYS